MTSARGYFFARVVISGILICYLYVGGRLFVTPQLRVINHVGYHRDINFGTHN